jgi:hypothetical protein
MELSLNSGDFARVTYNFTGITRATDDDTPANITPSASYAEKIPIFYNALISIDPGTGAVVVKAKSVTLKIDRPITPDYILGSEYADNLIQSGNITVTGSIGLAASEYSLLLNAMTTGDEGDSQPATTNKNTLGGGILTISLKKPNADDFQTITVGKIFVTAGTMSAEGRQVMTKSVEFTAQVNLTENVTFGSITV